jgi:HK97 gp10 family phage protein
MATFKIEGLAGALDRMRKLSPRLQKSGARRAMRKGANLVRDSARAKASMIDDPASAAEIWKNIITQESRRGKRLGGILMRVGVRGGSVTRRGAKRVDGGPGGITVHWRHVELGNEHTRAQPFMLPALASNVGSVTDTVVEELKIELDRLGV